MHLAGSKRFTVFELGSTPSNFTDKEKAANVHAEIFDELSYESASAASKRDRAQRGKLQRKNLVYGEVTSFSSVMEILRCCKPRQCGGTFVDLGSGSGRAVLAAALSGVFDKALGVELLPSLHNIALQGKQLYNLKATAAYDHARCESALFLSL
jgi:hypothetical protein